MGASIAQSCPAVIGRPGTYWNDLMQLGSLVSTISVMAVLVSGCATATRDENPQTVVCSPDLYAPLRFSEGLDTLSTSFAGSLGFATRATTMCNILSVQVVGLPQPGSETLPARRAAVVLSVLQGFGVPYPTFLLGDARAQAQPFISIEAEPK